MTTHGSHRCLCAYLDDPTECGGPAEQVVVTDRFGHTLPGCVDHAATLISRVDGTRVLLGPDGQPGDAFEAFGRGVTARCAA
jgi:hypothetical protein